MLRLAACSLENQLLRSRLTEKMLPRGSERGKRMKPHMDCLHTDALTVDVSLTDLVRLVNISFLVVHAPIAQMPFNARGAIALSNKLVASAHTNAFAKQSRLSRFHRPQPLHPPRQQTMERRLALAVRALLNLVLGWANISKLATEEQRGTLPKSATSNAPSAPTPSSAPVVCPHTCARNTRSIIKKTTPLPNITRDQQISSPKRKVVLPVRHQNLQTLQPSRQFRTVTGVLKVTTLPPHQTH